MHKRAGQKWSAFIFYYGAAWTPHAISIFLVSPYYTHNDE